MEGAADVDAGGGIGHAHALDVVVLSGDDFCGFFADDVVDAAVGGEVAEHAVHGVEGFFGLHAAVEEQRVALAPGVVVEHAPYHHRGAVGLGEGGVDNLAVLDGLARVELCDNAFETYLLEAADVGHKGGGVEIADGEMALETDAVDGHTFFDERLGEIEEGVGLGTAHEFHAVVVEVEDGVGVGGVGRSGRTQMLWR